MNQATWKRKIVKACKDAGTYRPFFSGPIDTLSAMLERRDNAEVLLAGTARGRTISVEQKQLLRLIRDLNRDALAYWVQLGLTPAGLRKINEQAIAPKKRSILAEALKELEG